MPVKIRLARRGRKKKAMYDIVVADSRAPRDGRSIEKIGYYNPNTDPATINFDSDKAFDWIMKGAQATDTVRAMLSYRGVMMKKHLQVGVNKGAITQEEADKKMEDWLQAKEAKIQGKVEKLTKEKVVKVKATLEVETKIKEARVEVLEKKMKVATTALVEEIREGAAEDNDDVSEIEDVQVAKTKKEETPVKAIDQGHKEKDKKEG